MAMQHTGDTFLGGRVCIGLPSVTAAASVEHYRIGVEHVLRCMVELKHQAGIPGREGDEMCRCFYQAEIIWYLKAAIREEPLDLQIQADIHANVIHNNQHRVDSCCNTHEQTVGYDRLRGDGIVHMDKADCHATHQCGNE